jgi:hypothetical protein
MELDRFTSGEYECITSTNTNYDKVVMEIRKGSNMVQHVTLSETEVIIGFPTGSSIICFCGDQRGTMACRAPPPSFNEDAFVTIVFSIQDSSDNVNPMNVIYFSGSIALAGFVAGNYFNKIFQCVFLENLAIENAVERVKLIH